MFELEHVNGETYQFGGVSWQLRKWECATAYDRDSSKKQENLQQMNGGQCW